MQARKKLSLDTLRVETFVPQEEVMVLEVGISLNTRCPTRIDSTCPCCTSPELCGL